MFAQMSLFEILMLVCFGAAWPFSIYKSYTSRSVSGKSPYFLMIVMTGYVSGILHKLFYSYDQVIFIVIRQGYPYFYKWGRNCRSLEKRKLFSLAYLPSRLYLLSPH